jgi:hypothetical protein
VVAQPADVLRLGHDICRHLLRNRAVRPGAIAIWIGVVSHWVLDWISHGLDMPLYPGGARYGLGL